MFHRVQEVQPLPEYHLLIVFATGEYGKAAGEAFTMYIQLDSDDQGEIRGEMKQMLKADKYSVKKELKKA